jgi:hypothetical protein
MSLTIILFTRVTPRTKSKGLLIDASQIFYYFQHMLRCVQKAMGSIVFVAQQVSSSMVWLYPKPREHVS